MGCCPRGSSVRGFLQARILEWVAISSSRGSSWSRDRTCISRVSCIGRRNFFLLPLSRLWSPDTCICITESLFYAPETSTTLLNKHERKKVKVAQSCPTLWDPMDCIVHGILQGRILKWVAFPFSRGSSQTRDQTQVSLIAGGFFISWATRDMGRCPLSGWESSLSLPVCQAFSPPTISFKIYTESNYYLPPPLVTPNRYQRLLSESVQ